MLHDALMKHLPVGASCAAPRGGYFLWVVMDVPGATASALLALCKASEAVNFRGGELFSPTNSYENCIRLSFSKLDDGAMLSGAAALGRAMAVLFARIRLTSVNSSFK